MIMEGMEQLVRYSRGKKLTPHCTVEQNKLQVHQAGNGKWGGEGKESMLGEDFWFCFLNADIYLPS
jgi:hypothetical protein